MHFDEDVNHVFRERDRDSMRSGFDLCPRRRRDTPDAILDLLECRYDCRATEPGPPKRVAVFRRWV